MNSSKLFLFMLAFGIIVSTAFDYPIDGYKYTEIDRLYYLQKVIQDSIKYNRIPPGAYKTMEDIKLNLTSISDRPINAILTENDQFSREVNRIIPGAGYSLAVLDISDPENLRYAGYKENTGYQPGSVGKIMVLNAIMNEMSKLCPDSWEERAEYFRNLRVGSRYWGTGDHHTIPIYNIEKEKLSKRQVISSDEFSLYEWMDHMVSVSNNGAASVVFREAMLMHALGQEYFGLDEKSAEAFFENTDRDSLTYLAHRVVNQPMIDLGIDEDEWRLGGMFTDPAGKYVGRKGGSIGTPRGLMEYLVLLEQGKVIDERTSLEIKRILYITDRRIRYAQNPVLDSAAVYFKSGSFYKCDRNKDPNCKAYAGNVYNYMNSVIIVEHGDGTKYIVCLMTNVLNKNSAGAHSYLADKIDDLVRAPME